MLLIIHKEKVIFSHFSPMDPGEKVKLNNGGRGVGLASSASRRASALGFDVFSKV